MKTPDPAVGMAGRALAEQALSRAAGTPLLGGNRARLLYDSGENFPAWLAAIREARASVYIEMYLFADDAFGRTLRDALAERARAGVDVRLLVPRSSDIGWIATVSRTQYRPLLEAGVRVFEWNGPMIHAKTAVADGRWARIGSTNLNVSSWRPRWKLAFCRISITPPRSC